MEETRECGCGEQSPESLPDGGAECPRCRTKKRTDEEKRALLNRLSRIEGQLRGLRRMVEEDAWCPDILTQSAAASSAMDAFSRELLAEHLRTCVVKDLREGREETIEELVRTIRRLM